MDAESCNNAFASKQEMVCHSEKICSMKRIEQFPDFPGAEQQIQIPTPNILQNETKQIIKDYIWGPYICSACGAKFRYKEKAREHLNLHKTKKCHICEYETAYNSHLDRHLRSHTNHTLKYHQKICPEDYICSARLINFALSCNVKNRIQTPHHEIFIFIDSVFYFHNAFIFLISDRKTACH